MNTEIQNRPIPGITWKLVVGFASTIILVATSVEVGIFSVKTEIQILRSNMEEERRMNKYILDGFKESLEAVKTELKDVNYKLDHPIK